MVRFPALAAFPLFVPNAHGIVQITSVGPVEIMDVFFSGLPPNTGFDFFVIQAFRHRMLHSDYVGIKGISKQIPEAMRLISSWADLILKPSLWLPESPLLQLCSGRRIRALGKIPKPDRFKFIIWDCGSIVQ
jgi:hypothetical protein